MARWLTPQIDAAFATPPILVMDAFSALIALASRPKTELAVHIMPVLKVHASSCDIEHMVHSEELRAAFVVRLKKALTHARIAEWGAGVRLASIGSVTAKAASKWLNAESMPGRSKMHAIADELGVRVEWLQYGEGQMTDQPALEGEYTGLAGQVDQPVMTSRMTRLEGESNVSGDPLQVRTGSVPVVGKAMLGPDGYFEALEYPVGHGEGILNIFSTDPNAYGLRVVGHSMKPRIKHNEFVLVEPNKEYVAGDEVLVKTQAGQSMIKEFVYFRDGQYRFDSVNADFEPIYLAREEIISIHYVGAIVKSSRFVPAD